MLLLFCKFIEANVFILKFGYDAPLRYNVNAQACLGLLFFEKGI